MFTEAPRLTHGHHLGTIPTTKSEPLVLGFTSFGTDPAPSGVRLFSLVDITIIGGNWNFCFVGLDDLVSELHQCHCPTNTIFIV